MVFFIINDIFLEIFFLFLFFVLPLVSKMTPRPSLVPDSDNLSLYSGGSESSSGQLSGSQQQISQQNNNSTTKTTEPGKPPSRAGACRVCLKSFKPDDYSRTCYECQQRVCEDCASYSKLEENEDEVSSCTHFHSFYK